MNFVQGKLVDDCVVGIVNHGQKWLDNTFKDDEAYSMSVLLFAIDFNLLFCRCDNHFMPEAKTRETEGKLVIEFKTEKGHENKMFKDDREKQRERVLMPDSIADSESDEDFKWTALPITHLNQ